MNKRKKILFLLGIDINLKKEWKTIIITDILSFVAILLIIVIKCFVDKNYSKDLIYLSSHISVINTFFYGVFCFIQEILARGFLQRTLKRKTNDTLLSIILTTIIFSLFHYSYDTITIVGAIIISIIAGITTDKKDNILIGFLFHWIFGGFGYIYLASPF